MAAYRRRGGVAHDARPDVWTKAGARLHSIVGNHPLIDGNKRLSWLATSVFLELNDASVRTAANDDVYELVMAAAAGALSVDGIAVALRCMHDQQGVERDRRNPNC